MKLLPAIFGKKSDSNTSNGKAANTNELVDRTFDDMVRFYAEGGLADEKMAQRQAAVQAWSPLFNYAAKLTVQHLEDMKLRIDARQTDGIQAGTDFVITIRDSADRERAQCEFTSIGPENDVLVKSSRNAYPLNQSFDRDEMSDARECLKKWLAIQVGTHFDKSRQNPEAEINITVNGRTVKDITPESMTSALELRA